jgi:hypothetical protein
MKITNIISPGLRPAIAAAALVLLAVTSYSQTPQIFEEFNPWVGNVSPDGIWRKNGVWVASGGNTFDPVRCILTSTYPGESSGGFLTLRSLANSLNGAEIQTLPKYKYGYYETRLKVTGVGDPANNRGVVVSFFIVDYDVSGWEVDFEFLTNGSWINSPNSGEVTLNYHLPNGGGSAVHYHTLPFNPKNAFHHYGILYQPGRLDWTVDGVIVYTVNNAGFTNPYGAFIMMNSWTGNSNWGGLAPTQNADSVYDWVKFYPDVTSVPGTGSPDLIVTAVSWTPSSPSAGQAVTFSATIKNQGTAPTPSGVIHGVLFSVDGTPMNWSDTSTDSLAPGASRTLTANGGPSGSSTWTATVGSHTILANVDDVNRIAESNESNNTLSAPLTVGAGGGVLAPTGLTARAGKKKATLTWNQSTSPNITQNKIYRSTTGSGGPYTLRATIASAITYVDTGLTSGSTYFYAVTAVNNSNQESPFSSYAGATAR